MTTTGKHNKDQKLIVLFLILVRIRSVTFSKTKGKKIFLCILTLTTQYHIYYV